MLNLKNRDFRVFLTLFFTIVFFDLFLELFLINKKYDIFSGGFLQANPITGRKNIFNFSLAFFSFNVFLYLSITSLWCFVSKKINAKVFVSSYNFVWFVIGGTIGIVAIRYELAKYFGDFLTFAVVKNLGGGDFFSAVIYAINEGIAFIFGIFVLAIVWFVGGRIIKEKNRGGVFSVKSYIFVWAFVSGALGMSGMLFLIDHNKTYRYHLKKTTAYIVSDLLMGWVVHPNKEHAALTKPENYSPTEKPVFSYAGTKKNIVLIVLESMRSDAIEKNVNGRAVMPNLNAIAATGTSSKSYYSHTGYTTTSLEAIFTSTATGVGAPVLLPVLRKNGYGISMISGQNEDFGEVSSKTGMKKYADFYFDAASVPEKRVFSSAAVGSLAVSNHEVISQFKKRADTVNWNSPQFFYVNIQSAHFPYYYEGMPKIITNNPLLRSDIKAENIARVHETYWNSVAYADWAIGEIVDYLKQKKIYENSLLVIVGDHGESLFDDGLLGHGMKISDEQMRTVFVTNIKSSSNELMGHADLGEFMLLSSGAVASARRVTEGKPVFHIIGSVENPNYIGYSMPKDEKVVIDMVDKIYHRQQGKKLEVLTEPKCPNEGDWCLSLDKLINEWRIARWDAHVFSEIGEGVK